MIFIQKLNSNLSILVAWVPSYRHHHDCAGFVRVRTEYSDVLYFESSLVNSIEVTGVHLHLSPGGGSVFGEPFQHSNLIL